MKTTLQDFIYCSLALTALCLFSITSTSIISHAITRRIFDEYFVIFDLFVFLLSFGIGSSIAALTMLKLWPFEAGTYDMNSQEFMRWKLFTVIVEFGKKALAPFTTVFARPLIEKMFGAKIGKHTAIGGTLVDGHMITLEDEAIVGERSIVAAHYITNGKLTLKPAVLRKGAIVGGGAIVMSSEIGEGSVIVPTSLVMPDNVIPPGELWGGFPARRIRKTDEAPDTNSTKSRNRF